ncbi:MAG: T9SS type A sorting domain-containing protein [Chitinophagales bacterium]|jgi:hypothetical protein|nr:T9SS type A sorting domain-containing protein [Bacteroidota bacterium]MBK9554834.1 T9SS type A sorting domain-containing protein [Bacteroidota bacterium]MBP9880118.1 T9SS type A sorting domain-containing protein [Chitinophagales bacterium]
MKKLLFLICLSLLIISAKAQVSSDYAVLVSSTITEAPPTVTLIWPAYATATEYKIYKKEKSDASWGTAIATLGGTAINYLDTEIIIDSAYEYKVERTASSGIVATGYILCGIKMEVVDYRGTCLLVIDTTITMDMESEIYQLKKDISGDGWSVEELHVARDMQPIAVREIIISRAEANEDINALYLFGRVPVLYSGNIYPDGHPEHQGAWPADAIYADVDVDYSDVTVDNIVAFRPENQNIPGDGKYDQSQLKSKIEMQIGRVDLFNMPSFVVDEATLLKRYIDSEHNFKHGIYTFNQRGLIDDNFGAFGGEAFASSGWRNFGPMFTANEIYEADYFTTMYNDSYLWSFGCGGGWFQGASGVGTTTEFAADTVKSAFTMLFGSYFGDWDAIDNFLRAPLASGMTLTNCWAGRPHWQFHQMALGENIGYSVRVTQNNTVTYEANIFPHYVHLGFMGDPTLRMHNFKPVADVTVSQPEDNTVAYEIDFEPSPDIDVLGYYVYRSSTEFGKYERITTMLINEPYLDETPLPGYNFYMVKAVKLETTPSGSYYNTSIGITDSISNNLTAIQHIENTQFELFPNPATNVITITFDVSLTNAPYAIYTLEGKLCKTGLLDINQSIIDISTLTPGYYMIQINEQYAQFVKMAID